MPEESLTISVLRNLEQRIENLVEGVFSRAFSSQVQPVEIARKLAKEMDAHRTASVSRVYVPNQYTVWLSTEDRKRLEGYESSLEQELSSYLLEHARRHDYALLTRPEVNLESDERLRLGEFGIQTRLVKPPARQGEAPEQGEQGHTMVYSVPPKDTKSRKRRPTAHLTETKAIVSLDDRRYVLDGPVAVARPLARVRLRAERSQRLPPSRRVAPRLHRRLADRGPRVDQRRQGQRPAGRRVAAGAGGRGRPGDRPVHLRHRAVVDTEPIAVALKFGFLAVLYLFLLWVSRSALRELRKTGRAGARGDRLPPDRARGPRGADRCLARRGHGRRAARERAL